MTNERTYEVRITGVLPGSVLGRLDSVEVARQEMRTVLSGRFTDQAALFGFLQRLRSLCLEVVEVRQVAGPPETAGPPSPDRPGGADRPGGRRDEDAS